ncbi:putative radial spoke head protein 9-like [Apostichopus japonicus]|uniref:Radial spoke head protein 9 homolog n=1 Tax=Stichopus japonicus TaxID=307972 RepID=A0A2G8L4E9_STIJA|nr:putative radial spoke head protein 9-like [Apostichopus japonicus]
MESDGLHLNISYVGSCGIILSGEQKAALETSLVILQNNHKFNRVFLWGKILGVKNDYFIAQGTGNDEMADRKTLYSLDCVAWGLLPQATQAIRDQCSVVKGRFHGDPAHEYEHIEIQKIGEGEDSTEEESTNRSFEGISIVVCFIGCPPLSYNMCTLVHSVCPGLFYNERLRNFYILEGLSVTEAGKQQNYCHFREPVRLNEKSLLEKADLDKSIDFLDPINEDIPKGSWSLKFERGSGLVTITSLLWPGTTFYHVPHTRKYGWIYVGTGEKNKDLPFML